MYKSDITNLDKVILCGFTILINHLISISHKKIININLLNNIQDLA